jgi:hypothetical protein
MEATVLWSLMVKMQNRLDSFKADVYSQFGEDGVIREIIRRTGLVVDNGFWCVEFGAWDGIHFSNTFALVEEFSAQVVMIEGDYEKFRALQRTAEKHLSIFPVEGFVVGDYAHDDQPVSELFTGRFNPAKIASLDSLLSSTPCPLDYDLLSIDIDSYDLETWAAHKEFKPKIVVIEVNSSLPPGILQWHGGRSVGNSFSSTLEVAKAKGYSLVCHTGNMIFVRNDLAHLVELDELDISFPERLFNVGWLPAHRGPKNRLSRHPFIRFLQLRLQKELRHVLGA